MGVVEGVMERFVRGKVCGGSWSGKARGGGGGNGPGGKFLCL